jgi:sigma-B regulation protein RsbU (phosphoserine phosphatase)
VELIEKKGGIALGFIDQYSFPTGYIQLNPGDSLVLYTDGVNEALDENNRMFHVSGIEDTLKDYVRNASAETIVKGLALNVEVFVGTAPQSDDITILAVRYGGPPVLH